MVAADFVAIGDLHLQSTNARNAARLRAFDDIIRDGLARPNLAAWLQLGDVFHGRSSVQDRNDLSTRLQAMAERAHVVLVVGNHEQEGDTEILGRLASRYPIIVAAAPKTYLVNLPTGGQAAIACCPYPHKAGLITDGTTADTTLGAGHDALESIFRVLGLQLSEAKAMGAMPLFIGHLAVGGAKASTGQPMIGLEIEADGAMLALLGDVPKLLGHIHAPQVIHGASYAGSVCRIDFGEAEEKRFLVVHYSEDGYRIESRPIDIAPMFHCEGTLARDGFTWEVRKGQGGESTEPPTSWQGTEVRVRVQFAASERDVLDFDLARAPFEGALTLQVEPVAIPDGGLRSPEVASAKTLPDKLIAWAQTNGQALPDGVLDKLGRLEHGDGAETLTAVSQTLASAEEVRA